MAFSRRTLLALAAAAALTACHPARPWHSTDVGGSTPDLKFSLTRATDGKTVTAADYRGKVVLLYFGYTYCPDICPTTLAHVAQVLTPIDSSAKDVRVLFITVDPARDDLKTLRDYAANFGPEFVGLRGSPDELAALAKRYRVAYSVKPDPDPAKYVVSHSSALYAFDRNGHARLLMSDLSSANPDLKGDTADIRRLIAEKD
ncbi:MAG: SCO family protein [Sphingomonas sp.]